MLLTKNFCTIWITKSLVLLFIGIFGTQNTNAQALKDSVDLFSKENSERYADYLYESAQFRLAISEYERLLYRQPFNEEVQLRLISSYRLYGDFSVAHKRLNQFTERAYLMLPLENYELRTLQNKGYRIPSNAAFHKEYLRLHIQQRNYQHAIGLLRNSAEYFDDPTYVNNLLTGSLLANAQFDAAKAQNMEITHQALRNLLLDYDNRSKKNPGVAAGLSTLVPGLGKAYVGRWQDGAISLLFVSVNSWAAYRAFSRNGIGSPYGWVFGTVGASFYLGNIVGSNKAAKKHNSDQLKRIQEKAHETTIRLY